MPAIGKQDPKKVKSASQDVYGANPDVLDAMLAGAGEGNSTGADAAEKKGKRRKA